MHDVAPTVYLLAGPAGSGKRTYAKALERAGVQRLAVEDADRQELNERLVAHLEAGRDVVLDHGLEQADERDFYKHLVEQHGGQWCVIHLSVDHTELIKRLEQRAAQTGSVPMTNDALASLISGTQAKEGGGEVVAPSGRS